jgi:hypothetical protein
MKQGDSRKEFSMRVISNDRTLDIPYERFVFAVTKDNAICAASDVSVSPEAAFNGIIANYSNQEKTIKAMEMMHDAYIGVSKNVAMITECRIFQFPKDDEV